MRSTIRIATRKSPLALWQAHFVQSRLQQLYPQLRVELLPMSTKGDKILDSPLAKVGGKGLFVKELEQAILAGDADIAVHSMKDVPVEFPDGLGLSIICERDDPRDAFVSSRFSSMAELPAGSRVGTSSLRRQCQLRASRPGEYDAILLAAAGLKRLGLQARITTLLPPEQSLPANGQGAVGIECCLDDDELLTLLAPLEHGPTRQRVLAERAMNRALQGGCQVPIGAYAELEGDQLWLRGLVGSPDGRQILHAECRGAASEPEALGQALADQLLAQGAARLLAEVYGS